MQYPSLISDSHSVAMFKKAALRPMAMPSASQRPAMQIDMPRTDKSDHYPSLSGIVRIVESLLPTVPAVALRDSRPLLAPGLAPQLRPRGILHPIYKHPVQRASQRFAVGAYLWS